MTLISRFLDTNGDGSGTKNANGDYSGAAQAFFFDPEDNYVNLTRMLICVVDTAGFQAEEYGNTGGVLANGIEVKLVDGSTTIVDFTDGLPVKTNSGWATFCHDAQLKEWGAGDELLTIRWTFSKSGRPLELHGDLRLEIVLNDDLTGLLGHYFVVQGFK